MKPFMRRLLNISVIWIAMFVLSQCGGQKKYIYTDNPTQVTSNKIERSGRHFENPIEIPEVDEEQDRILFGDLRKQYELTSIEMYASISTPTGPKKEEKSSLHHVRKLYAQGEISDKMDEITLKSGNLSDEEINERLPFNILTISFPLSISNTGIKKENTYTLTIDTSQAGILRSRKRETQLDTKKDYHTLNTMLKKRELTYTTANNTTSIVLKRPAENQIEYYQRTVIEGEVTDFRRTTATTHATCTQVLKLTFVQAMGVSQ